MASMDIIDLLLSAKLRIDLLIDLAVERLFIEAALFDAARALKIELDGFPGAPRGGGRKEEVTPETPPRDAMLLDMAPLVETGPPEVGEVVPPNVAVDRARLSAIMDLALAALD